MVLDGLRCGFNLHCGENPLIATKSDEVPCGTLFIIKGCSWDAVDVVTGFDVMVNGELAEFLKVVVFAAGGPVTFEAVVFSDCGHSLLRYLLLYIGCELAYAWF